MHRYDTELDALWEDIEKYLALNPSSHYTGVNVQEIVSMVMHHYNYKVVQKIAKMTMLVMGRLIHDRGQLLCSGVGTFTMSKVSASNIHKFKGATGEGVSNSGRGEIDKVADGSDRRCNPVALRGQEDGEEDQADD